MSIHSWPRMHFTNLSVHDPLPSFSRLNARDWLKKDTGVVTIPLSPLSTSDTQPVHVNKQADTLDLVRSVILGMHMSVLTAS